MGITLSEQTQNEIERRMKVCGVADPDQVVMAALNLFDRREEVLDYDDLDDETKAAIEEADAQIEKGLGVPWEQARERLFGKYLEAKDS
jgi:hypothetical protein